MPMMHLNDVYTYALWRFDEPTGSIAYDSAGKHDIHLIHSLSQNTDRPIYHTTGRYKQNCLIVPSTGSVYSATTTELNSVLTGSWTLEFVTKQHPYENSPFRGILLYYGSDNVPTTTRTSASLMVGSGTPIGFAGYGVNCAWDQADNSAGFNFINDSVSRRSPTNVYMHTAIVKSVISPGISANLRLYHDGILVRDSTGVDHVDGAGRLLNDRLIIASGVRSINSIQAGTAYPFSGTIEEIRISNKQRTGLEIADSVLRCYKNSIHEGNPFLLSTTFPNISGALDQARNVTRLRLNFSKHMSAVTLATASNYTINPNSATIAHVTGGFDQTYCDLLISNFSNNTLYFITASNLLDIDGNMIQSGSNVVVARNGFGVNSALINLAASSRRTCYHMRGKNGSSYVYWLSYDAPDKTGIYAPVTGLADIVIDNVYYDPA